MIRTAATGLILALLMIASPATAQPFDAFRMLCLDPGGGITDAVAAARQAGWRQLRAGGTEQADDVAVWVSSPRADGLMEDRLIAGLMEEPDGRLLEVCSVMGAATADEMVASMEAWAGFRAGYTSTGNPGWVFTRGPQGVVPRPTLVDADTPQLRALAATAGTVYGVGVRTARDGPFLFHFRVPAP